MKKENSNSEFQEIQNHSTIIQTNRSLSSEKDSLNSSLNSSKFFDYNFNKRKNTKIIKNNDEKPNLNNDQIEFSKKSTNEINSQSKRVSLISKNSSIVNTEDMFNTKKSKELWLRNK